MCNGDGAFECIGSADPKTFIDDDDPEDVFRGAALIFYARERSWSPTEFLAQPAKWARAYEFMLPYMLNMLEEVRERHRNKMKNNG